MVLKNLLTSTAIALSAVALVSCGGSGGSSVPPPPPPPPPTDMTAPVVSFSPATLTVESEETGTSTLTATDNVGVVSGPTVTCTNGGSFAAGIFTAPAVTLNTTSVCTAAASDAAGNSGSGTLTVTILPPSDPEPPTVSFSPATLTVTSEQTGVSTVTAMDNIGVTTGPTVTCTNGGSFSGDTFTAPRTGLNTTSICTASAGDAVGNIGTGTLTVTVNQAPPSGDVNVTGVITFDRVPFNTATNGLNYNAISQDPARGITVEAINAAGTVLQSDVTDVAGAYEFTIAPNTDMRVRAKAEMVQTTGAQWDVQVVDNTSSGALYSIAGSLLNVGTLDTARNLNAGSGWGGNSYIGTRAAAPFAILNPIYDALKKFEAIDSAVVFPAVDFNWSVNNRPTTRTTPIDYQSGAIRTSSYVKNSAFPDGAIFILGDDNSDTDEYDDHVVVHEWGHYFEDKLSRSDSLGGLHSRGERLDPRVALGEGFGNALSGMITDDPFYRDSLGVMQSSGFEIDVERNDNSPEGWFNEGSVQSILYDIYDSVDDGADSLSLGLGPIYGALTSDNYKTQPLFTTIFSVMDEIKNLESGSAAGINALSAGQSISGTGQDGAGETNNGGTATELPVYKTALVNGAAVRVCSSGSAAPETNPTLYNKLGNRDYVKFNVSLAGVHTLRMVRVSGASSRDPDFVIFKNSAVVAIAESAPSDSEVISLNLTPGEHVVDTYDLLNVALGGTPGQACYNFNVTG